jgi:Flp pilus assembly protein CpaB
MRRGRIIFLLVLIVIVGVAVMAVALGFIPTGSTPSAVATEVTSVPVYYAGQNIPQGTVITEEMLSTFSIPRENVNVVMFELGEEQNLIGQTARFSLDQGTLITSSMVGAAPGDLPGPRWATLVPPGMVAVAIPTNRLSVAAYGINDGAHVNVNACITFVDVDPAYQTLLPNYVAVMRDIYFPEGDRPYISIDPLTAEQPARQGRVELDPTFQKPIYTVPSEIQRPRLVCQMVLQDVVVMNLGNFELRPPSTDPNTTPSPGQAQEEAAPDIVTLMVTPQDSIALNYFVYSGALISMSLRNPNDNSRIEAQSATLTSILTQYNISLPSKLPYAQQPRLDVLAPPLLPNDIISVQPQQ